MCKICATSTNNAILAGGVILALVEVNQGFTFDGPVTSGLIRS